ncbi:MAG: helix-turn-helix domain containing protein [Alistipes sp.]|nr:helix-turn-helix domain containing protein [Alistipes sp.]
MAGKTKNYTEEFKKQIVNLAKSGRSARSIAQDYGISKSSVTKWVRDFNNSGSFRACSHKNNVRIFEHNFCGYKAKKLLDIRDSQLGMCRKVTDVLTGRPICLRRFYVI